MRRDALALACALDVVLGDPPGWPHPVRAFGALIAAVDRRRDAHAAPADALLHGAVLTGALVAASVVVGRLVERRCTALAIVLGASTLAARSLDDAVAAVQRSLEDGDLVAARRALAAIVGRDVAHLQEAEIAAAALESLAESFCDGVVAPLLWLRLGGVGGALAFKAISTLDSMIGHREPPYTWFGRAAARADDAANFVPARIAAAAIALAAGARGAAALRVALRDAPRHASPNGGWPEAALAGALGVRLGGEAWYDGLRAERAVLHAAGRAPCAGDLAHGRILIACAAMAVTLAAIGSAR
ncbi:MAG TPA: adenosylcobinamide-phosphate synthase CbiB [Candidatus Limnocylindria bacterium]|nr:adenosylcobinamide-phosphate synthase CbiB [Candidatus Limnocylindria bacterium]